MRLRTQSPERAQCAFWSHLAVAATEFMRPWRLATLAAGIGLLIAGSIYTPAPDWDIPISIIMALVACVIAPWAMRVFVTRDWARWPMAIFATWFGVDGCYWIYWFWQNPQALELMREANAPASLSMYLAVGLFWIGCSRIGADASVAASMARTAQTAFLEPSCCRGNGRNESARRSGL